VQALSVPMRLRGLVSLTIVAAPFIATGCPRPGAVAQAVRPKPSVEVPGEARCGVAKDHAEPLVVEWPSSVRAKLEALAHKGLIAVRWKGCELEVLQHCKVPGAYAWTPITRKEDRVSMRDQDELWANVPIGAGGLESKLARSGALHVTMTIVGRWEADRDTIARNEVAGDCSRVTHVVTGMTAGAFDFWAGADASVAGGASVFNMGAGAKSASSAELINRDGDVSSCVKSTNNDKSPPDGCGALLRIELAALGVTKAATTPECSDKTAWDGKQCAALVTGSGAECPAGFAEEGGQCQKIAPAPSPSAATPQLTKICTYGDAIECTRLCDTDGDASSCNDLALMLSRGDGITMDEKKATTFFLRACDLGNAIGCNNAGMRAEYGRGVNKDEAHAASLYEKACDRGMAAACNNLGRMVINGWGIAKDEPRAVDLFRKGCGQGDVGACANLGWCYVRGKGVVADRTVGVAFLRKACKGGNSWSCDRMKDLKEPI
jgi:TPR repeat protein